MMITNDWRSVFGTKEKIDDKVTDKIKREVEKHTSIPLFILGDEIEMERLTDCLIDYFTNEEE